MAFPEDDPTPAERAAIKKLLVSFKRFWNSQIQSTEDVKADQVIDAFVELVRESEE